MWYKFKQFISFYTAILILLHAVIPHHHHSIHSTVEGDCSHVSESDHQHSEKLEVIDLSNTHQHHHQGLHVDHEFDIGECQLKKSKLVKLDISIDHLCDSYYPILIEQLSLPVDEEVIICSNNDLLIPDFHTKSFSLRGPPALI